MPPASELGDQVLILSNGGWRDGIKSPIDTQVWHIQLTEGHLETQQRAGSETATI